MTALSVSTCFDYAVPIEEQVPLVAATGFTHLSPSRADHAGYLDQGRRRNLNVLLQDHNLGVDTIHGPDLLADGAQQVLRETAVAARSLGARTVVIHPTPFAVDPADVKNVVAAAAPRLVEAVETCRDNGVRLALENLFPGGSNQALLHLVADSDPEVVGMCYDSSHDQMDGPRPFDLLTDNLDRVIAVHLSDRSAPFIDHLAPGDGFIDFDAIASGLARSSFHGPLLFEVMVGRSEEKRPETLLANTYEGASRIAQKIDSMRQ